MKPNELGIGGIELDKLSDSLIRRATELAAILPEGMSSKMFSCRHWVQSEEEEVLLTLVGELRRVSLRNPGGACEETINLVTHVSSSRKTSGTCQLTLVW